MAFNDRILILNKLTTTLYVEMENSNFNNVDVMIFQNKLDQLLIFSEHEFDDNANTLYTFYISVTLIYALMTF